MNKQREIIYKQRRLILEQKALIQKCLEVIEYHLNDIVNQFIPENNLKDVDWDIIKKELSILLPYSFKNIEQKSKEVVISNLIEQNKTLFNSFVSQFNKDELVSIMKIIYLHSLDNKWIEHLKNMDFLREGIGLRAYAQKDPLLEYKKEGYEMFQIMMDTVERDVISNLFKVKIVTEEEMIKIMEEEQKRIKITSYDREQNKPKPKSATVHKEHKTGRNEPCTCGSGKKYKNCCGKQI